MGDQRQTFDFPATLVEKSDDESFGFVEKLWAVRRMGEILDQIDLNGQNEELVRELVDLATRHGILTPYTSFLADERTNLYDLRPTRGGRAGGLERSPIRKANGRWPAGDEGWHENAESGRRRQRPH